MAKFCCQNACLHVNYCLLVYICTHFNPAPSGSPGGLSVRHSLPTTAELSWSAVPVEKQNGVVTGYKVKVVGPDSPGDIPVHGAGTTSVQIPRLRAFTSYTFNVSAMTKAGTGPAATISSKTPEGGKMLIIGITVLHILGSFTAVQFLRIDIPLYNFC